VGGGGRWGWGEIPPGWGDFTRIKKKAESKTEPHTTKMAFKFLSGFLYILKTQEKMEKEASSKAIIHISKYM
jgi:hypothetical protein